MEENKGYGAAPGMPRNLAKHEENETCGAAAVDRIPAKATEGTPQKAPQKAKSVVDRIPAKATEGTPQKAPQKAKSVVDRIPAKATEGQKRSRQDTRKGHERPKA